MRILPRSLAGQLISLILCGLLTANLALQIVSGKGAGSMHQLSRDQILQRYTMAYRVLAACQAGCQQEALLQVLAAPDVRFSVRQDADVAGPMDEEEARLAARLEQGSGAPQAVRVHVRAEEAPVLEASPEEGAPAKRLSLNVSARLPDGRWLDGQLWPVVRSAWWRPIGYAMLASGLPVLIVITLFLGAVLKPLRTLARAAERISRGERTAALPESGPQELRELAAAFNIMQERLGRFVADRTRMIAAISHDFRTPITSLRLRAELVDDPELRSAMKRTLDEMRQMVEETLHFAHADSLQEATRVVDLQQLLQRLEQEQQLLGHDVRCREGAPFDYRCRPLALGRALTNLVDNAVRYGGSARLALETGDAVHILIDDDGPGISPDWLEKVFEPFARPDKGRARSAGGVGLGLAIARSCVEAHGGQIQLANRSEGGLRVRISLPA